MIEASIKKTLRKLANTLGIHSQSHGADLSNRLQDPPIPPADYEIHPPDFIGIGAQKCGTSWWYKLLSKHPQIYDSSYLAGRVSPAYLLKERHYFDRFYNREFLEEDAAEYAKWFARPNAMISGEWTPRYLVEHWAPLLVRAAAPNARLLVMVRDPVERFISGMRHTARVKSALDRDDAHVHYLRGLYYRQLKPWLNLFPRSQILVLQYEKCTLEPEHELRRSFAFLGLPAISTGSIDFASETNITRNQESFALDATHRQSLVESYRDDVGDLLREFPEIDGRLWNHFYR